MKAQASTEFIIIFGISLVLVGIGLLAFSDYSGNPERVIDSSNNIELLTGDIGVTSYSMNARGLYIKLINNLETHIQVTNITLGIENQNSVQFPFTLVPGEEKEVYSYTNILKEGNAFDEALYISYKKDGIEITRSDLGSTPRLTGTVDALESYEILENEALSKDLLHLFHFDQNSYTGEGNGKYIDAYAQLSRTCLSSTCPTLNSSLGFGGHALQFDGDDVVDFPRQIESIAGAPTTVSLWMNSDDYGAVGNSYVFSTSSTGIGNYGMRIFVYDGGDVEFTMRDELGLAQSTIDANLSTGRWHNIVFTAHRNYMDAWINGVQVVDYTEADGVSNFYPHASNITLGRDLRTLTQFYVGYLDEIAIWNRTLSQEEINSIYNRGKVKFNLN